MKKFLLFAVFAFYSFNALADRPDYMYGCELELRVSSTSLFVRSDSKEGFLKKILSYSRYSWNYLGKDSQLDQGVLDREVKGPSCVRFEDSWTKLICSDVRDADGYEMKCDEQNLGKVIRYSR